jgi:acyl dehydratase
MPDVLHTEHVTTVSRLKELAGEELRISGWKRLTQQDVDAFADLTGERGWMHNDPQIARRSPFGGTIAQGNLILSMWSAMLDGGEGSEIDLPIRYKLNYGFNRVRYLQPVRVGDRIRAHLRLVAVEERAGSQLQLTWERTVEVEGGAKPAMVAETLARVFLVEA